jgi:hypothetical protein
MKDSIDARQCWQLFNNVVQYEREPRVGSQRLDVLTPTRDQIIQADDIVPVRDKTIAEVGPDEASSTSHQIDQSRSPL